MHINLPENTKHWIGIAEKFLETTQPWEVEAEMNAGKVPDDIDKKHRQMAIDLGLSSMDMPKDIGGQGLSNLEQVAVWMQSQSQNQDQNWMSLLLQKKLKVDI